MKYAVMVECRAGTRQLVGDRWEDNYHVITWTIEDDETTANRVAEVMAENILEVRSVWVNEQHGDSLTRKTTWTSR